MRITELHLQNFRNFAHLEWADIHPRLNVLVGVNGSGKTAVLEAVRCLMGEYLYDLTVGSFWGIADEHIRLVFENDRLKRTTGTRVEGKLEYAGTSFTAYRERESYKRETTPQSVTPLRNQGHQDLKRLGSPDSDSLTLPLLAYYSTQRLTGEKAFSKSVQKAIDSGLRQSGYLNTLDEKSNYNLIRELIKKDIITRQSRTDAGLQDSPFPVFPLVERAIQSVFETQEGTAEDTYYYDDTFRDIVIKRKQGTLPLGMHSDGYRNLIKLLLDLSCRAAYLNPQLGQLANEAPGLVLIDEIDLHLHPGLQRRIIPLLQKAFPNVQFIITTHSPQVVASVSNDSVWLLKNNKLERNKHLTYGSDTNSILTELYDVREYPDETVEKMENYYRILRSDEWNSTKAKALRSELEEMFGLNYPGLYEADDIIALKQLEV